MIDVELDPNANHRADTTEPKKHRFRSSKSNSFKSIWKKTSDLFERNLILLYLAIGHTVSVEIEVVDKSLNRVFSLVIAEVGDQCSCGSCSNKDTCCHVLLVKLIFEMKYEK